jgi:hypothetical protein
MTSRKSDMDSESRVCGEAPPAPDRRRFLTLAMAAGMATGGAGASAALPPPVSLLTIPVEVVGDWGGSLPQAARRVVLWMRAACLRGVRCLSDRQPQRLRVQDQAAGPPHVWLHSDPLTTAWIVVNIGPRDWSKLAYQFGHELGHVFANSWSVAARPRPPCQWLEEAMVEAFSIRGLGPLAGDWARDPPFPRDSAFSQAIQRYRSDVVERYRRATGATASIDLPEWFRASRADLERNGGLRDALGPAVLAVVAAFDDDVGCVEDLGALNRWPERSGLPIERYFEAWRRSCAEIGAAGRLPQRLKTQLGVG